MPTDKERSEIAARFREIENNIIEDTWFHWEDVVCESWHIILKSVGVDNGNPYDDYRKLCERLADLIEPEERTCYMTKYGLESVLAGWWACSECGPVYPPCNEEIAAWALQRCPRCGAKVVKYD